MGLFLRALRSRNLRLFFGGQGVSLTRVQQAALSWLVYRLSGSALLLGEVGFTSPVPCFFLAPVAGVYVDRWDVRRILLGTHFPPSRPHTSRFSLRRTPSGFGTSLS